MAVLLSVFASDSLSPVTEAELTNEPEVVELTLTRIVTEELLPSVRVGILQLMVVEPEQPIEADTKLTPPGRVSEITTPVAADGPLLVMVRV